jgi:flagellar hook protein FlgE
VLESFSIDEQGVVKGLFSNGQTLDLMQLALAKFASPDGLNPVGQNLFSQSAQSGEAVVAAPRTGGLGAIVSNALEISNVDLASQFVELIRAQQAFQANARIITTGDDLLTEVVNLRR